MPSIAVLPDAATENKGKQFIARSQLGHKGGQSCCCLCMSCTSPSLPKKFEYFPSLVFPKFVVCQWSWVYFINEVDSNDDSLGYSELKHWVKPTDGLKILVSYSLGILVKYWPASALWTWT